MVAWFALTCAQILRQAHTDEARSASVIVVFGAAEYAGRPSPIYRARLDHAFGLFRKGLAPVVITRRLRSRPDLQRRRRRPRLPALAGHP
ncbi:MAG TPA: hypothetical protein VKB60_05660 [Terriglobales bacterium]|nr:hypothetical protein [Terriglobales bacterium]